MKKNILLTAILLSLAFVFFGCGSDFDAKDFGVIEGPAPFDLDLKSKYGTLDLKDDYNKKAKQVKVDFLDKFDNIRKIEKGDSLILTLKFKLDKPSPHGLQFMMVDEDPSVGYWLQLTDTIDISTTSIAADTTIEETYTFIATVSAGGPEKHRNVLVIQTGEYGSANGSSASEDNIKITFETFKFERE